MKTIRFTSALTALNVLVLMCVFFRANSATTDAPVLRCRELYLVDDKGRVRAELKVTPPDPKVKMPDGTTGYPESVLFRLISSTGGPNIKIVATEDGGGTVVGGDGGYVQILARGTNTPFARIVAKDGREQTIKPQ